jgi:hypothetical protein
MIKNDLKLKLSIKKLLDFIENYEFLIFYIDFVLMKLFNVYVNIENIC